MVTSTCRTSLSDYNDPYDSPPEDPHPMSLGDQIVNTRCSSIFDDRDFFPNGSVSELLNKENIQAELPVGSEELITFIHTRARKSFAITLASGISGPVLRDAMKTFQRYGFTDQFLPISEEMKESHCYLENRSCSHRRALNAFHRKPWNGVRLSNFYDIQWKFLSPVFTRDAFRHEFSSHCILPFIGMDMTAKSGTFSQVFKVKIHKDHQKVFATV